jgi:phage tail P2-like protein
MSGECRTVLPTNIDERLNALDLLGCERLEPLDDAARALPTLRDALAVDARFLDVIADDLQTYFLSPDMSEEERRAAIAASWRVHRIKGTVGAMETAFAAIGQPVEISEWWEYDGEPYHYRLDVDVTGRSVDDTTIGQIDRMAQEMKNVRSALDGIWMHAGGSGVEVVASVMSCGESVTINPRQPDPVYMSAPEVRAAALHAAEIATIKYQEAA